MEQGGCRKQAPRSWLSTTIPTLGLAWYSVEIGRTKYPALESIPDFLRSKRPDGSACLVLDVRLPGASGLDFQRELAAANIKLPIIFITGYGDIPMSVQAMKGGAVEFLTKPFRQQELLDAIFLALAQDRAHQERERASSALKERLQALSSREREIMIQVAQGRLSNR